LNLAFVDGLDERDDLAGRVVRAVHQHCPARSIVSIVSKIVSIVSRIVLASYAQCTSIVLV